MLRDSLSYCDGRRDSIYRHCTLVGVDSRCRSCANGAVVYVGSLARARARDAAAAP